MLKYDVVICVQEHKNNRLQLVLHRTLHCKLVILEPAVLLYTSLHGLHPICLLPWYNMTPLSGMLPHMAWPWVAWFAFHMFSGPSSMCRRTCFLCIMCSSQCYFRADVWREQYYIHKSITYCLVGKIYEIHCLKSHMGKNRIQSSYW